MDRKSLRNLAWPLAALGLWLALRALAQVAPAPREVSYDAFEQALAQGRIAKVHVLDTRLVGDLKVPDDGHPALSAVRVEPDLAVRLERFGVPYERVVEGTWLRDLFSWIMPTAVFFGIWYFVMRRGAGGSGLGGLMGAGRSGAKVHVESDTGVTFADVAGIDEAKAELEEVVQFLQQPRQFGRLGARVPRGVLLVGPPGTGKTMLAKAVAGQAHVPFFSISGSEFVEMFVGVGAARVRDLFAQAESRAPCIIFIDELDALGKMRVPSALGPHEEREQTLNQLLAEMDGFDPRKGVIVMAATNRPEVLDPALLRPGRFDRQVVVDRPDIRGREAILRLHARSVKLAPDVDLKVVAARTAGCAGADLANLINEATLLAARKDRQDVSMGDIEEAIDRLLSGLKRKRVMSPHEREIVAYHEAGHAIAASVLPGVDPVHKISIVQRGYEALGHTLQLPAEEHYLVTRQALLNQLAVLLGGRSAEEIVFQEISTGAQNDLQRATDLARAMVAEYGMSDALGPVAFKGRTRQRFLEVPGLEPEPFAEETARQIDSEIKRLLVDAHARASGILRDRRDILGVLAERLIREEVVEGADVRALVAQRDAPAVPPGIPAGNDRLAVVR
jgi:cell division protease FtsH